MAHREFGGGPDLHGEDLRAQVLQAASIVLGAGVIPAEIQALQGVIGIPDHGLEAVEIEEGHVAVIELHRLVADRTASLGIQDERPILPGRAVRRRIDQRTVPPGPLAIEAVLRPPSV